MKIAARFIAILIGTFLLLGLFSTSIIPQAHAQALNSGGNCNGACWVIQDWSGNSHGGAVDEYVTRSSGTHTCQTFCWVERSVWVSNSSTGHFMHAGYGWCVEGVAGDCISLANLNPNQLYYAWGYDAAEHFQAVPSADINNYVHFQVSYYASGGGGMMVFIQGPSGYTCNGVSTAGCYWQGVAQTWPNIQLKEEAQGTFTGILGYTALRLNSKYQNASDGTWHYQFSDGSIIRGDNPPWGGWVSGLKPSQTSNGGEFYSCSIVAGSNPC